MTNVLLVSWEYIEGTICPWHMSICPWHLKRQTYMFLFDKLCKLNAPLNGPRQANLVQIAYASSEGSGEPVHPRSLARTSAARSYKQCVKRNLQTKSQLPVPNYLLLDQIRLHDASTKLKKVTYWITFKGLRATARIEMSNLLLRNVREDNSMKLWAFMS